MIERKKINFWTIAEIGVLRRLVSKRIRAARIVKGNLLPRHTLDSIQHKMRELGLCDPLLGQRVKNAPKMNSEQRQTLKEFLQGEGRITSSREVAEKFDIRQGVVFYYRRRLGLSLTRKEAIASRIYQEIRLKNVPKLRAGFKRYCRNFWKERRVALLRRYRQMEAAGCTAEQKICKKCHYPWFANSVFFYPHLTKAKGKQKERCGYSSFCRACGLPWKRKKRKLCKKS